MKTDFQLVWASGEKVPNVKMRIVGKDSLDEKPYVSISPYCQSSPIFIDDKDLERFAVNILKAIKSAKLKS